MCALNNELRTVYGLRVTCTAARLRKVLDVKNYETLSGVQYALQVRTRATIGGGYIRTQHFLNGRIEVPLPGASLRRPSQRPQRWHLITLQFTDP